jgi:hypothetical protein
MTKTKASALIIVLLAAAISIALFHQHRTATLLRSENEGLRSQLAAAKNASAIPIPALSQSSPLSGEQLSELLKLRAEVASLRSQLQKSLEASNAAQKTSPDISPEEQGELILADQLGDRGLTTPSTAFQTFLWTARSGDSNRISELLMVKLGEGADEAVANQMRAAQVKGMLKTFTNLASLRLIRETPESADTTRLRVEITDEQSNRYPRELYMVLDQEGWKPAIYVTRDSERTHGVRFFLREKQPGGSVKSFPSTSSTIIPIKPKPANSD